MNERKESPFRGLGLILPVKGINPTFGSDCFIAPNATIVGDVKVGKSCSIWFNAVVRGDVNSITFSFPLIF